MKCYYHHDRDAIGICKSCARGLCVECHVDLDKGMACGNRCEQDVRNLATLTDASMRTTPMSVSLIRSSRSTSIWSAVFMCTVGAAALVWGYFEYVDYGDVGFGVIFGLPFILYGLLSLVRGRRIYHRSREYPLGACQDCGYDLTGSQSGICPECGKPSAASRT